MISYVINVTFHDSLSCTSQYVHVLKAYDISYTYTRIYMHAYIGYNRTYREEQLSCIYMCSIPEYIYIYKGDKSETHTYIQKVTVNLILKKTYLSFIRTGLLHITHSSSRIYIYIYIHRQSLKKKKKKKREKERERESNGKHTESHYISVMTYHNHQITPQNTSTHH